MTNLSTIVLNWNRWEDTIECLESLLPHVRTGATKLVVVDNGSTDCSVDRLQDWLRSISARHNLSFTSIVENKPTYDSASQLVLIRVNKNLGYSRGNNFGIKYAILDAACEFVWILNNDTVVHECAVSALLAYAEKNLEVGIVGSTVVDYSDRNKVECAGGAYYNRWLTTYRPALKQSRLADVLATDKEPFLSYIYGAAMLLRSEMIHRVGLLNPKYFLYFEEIDYAERARRQGYGIGWCKAAIVYHKGNSNLGSKSSLKSRKLPQAEYFSNLSALIYTRSLCPRVFPVAFISRFSLKFVYYLLTGNFHLFAPLIGAYRDFCFGRGHQ